MSRSDRQSSEESSYPRTIASLRKTHDEARAVLDHQIRILDDIDDKATRTVRITALLVGAIASATSLVSDPAQFLNPGTKWGTISLVLSILLGTLTYSVSSPDLGPGPSDIERVRTSEYREDEWLVVILASYEVWIDRVAGLSRFNGLFLVLSQLSLGIGLLLFVFGVLDGLGTSVTFVAISLYSLPVQLVAILGAAGLLFSIFRSTFRVVR